VNWCAAVAADASSTTSTAASAGSVKPLALCWCHLVLLQAGRGLLSVYCITLSPASCPAVTVRLMPSSATKCLHAQTGNAKTTSLRICNKLLRRLSKAQNTVMCGHISLYLARALALDDRSGLNIHASVNLSNTTPIEDPEQVYMHLVTLQHSPLSAWCSLWHNDVLASQISFIFGDIILQVATSMLLIAGFTVWRPP